MLLGQMYLLVDQMLLLVGQMMPIFSGIPVQGTLFRCALAIPTGI